MAGRSVVLWRVARDPLLRRLEMSFVGFAFAEQATWLAILVYAYNRGGVGEAGLDVGGFPDRLLRCSDGRGVGDNVQPTLDGCRVAGDHANAERPGGRKRGDRVRRIRRRVPRAPRRRTRSRPRITGCRFRDLCGRHSKQRVPVTSASPRQRRQDGRTELATRCPDGIQEGLRAADPIPSFSNVQLSVDHRLAVHDSRSR